MLSLFTLPVGVLASEQPPPPQAKQAANIAVLAIRGVAKALEMWQPTAEYLSQQIPGYRFNILPVSIDSIDDTLKSGKVDFVLTNPALYASMEGKYGISRIATLRNRRPGGSYTQFGALIIARADRTDITDIRSLKDKSFMAVHPRAFGGWWMAWRILKQAGIDPNTDFSRLSYSGFPQDKIVFAVEEGRVDAGTVRTDVLERMTAEGKVKREDFKIINPQTTPGFPFAHSTRLYPEWPFATTRKASSELAQKVAIALLSLSPDSPAARAASSEGWTVPLDYQPVHELMKELHVGPYSRTGIVTLQDVFHQQRKWVIALAITMAVLIIAVFAVLILNRRLVQSKIHLENEVQERKRAESAELKQAERIRTLYEASSMPGQTMDERINEILGLGCKILDMEVGKVAFIDTENNTNTIVNVVAPEPFNLKPGIVWDLDKTFCSILAKQNMPIFAEHHVGKSKYKTHSAYINTQVEAYIGFPIKNNNTQFWSISFASPRPHQPFADTDIDLIKLMGRWVTVILDRRQSQLALLEAKEEAETANRIKSEFLANMSHELRTPLNAIIGYSELLQEEMKDKGLTQHRADIKTIHNAGNHLLSLINNILDLSKVEANRMEIHLDETHLKDFIHEAIATMTPAAAKNGNKILLKVEEDVVCFITDQIKLRQTLLNLLSNAIKFTQAGIITIDCGWHIKEQKKLLRISIQDTGIGISEEDLCNLFKPFTQVDQATNRRYEGTGLGLAISLQFCKLLKGDIEVESIEGKGSVFSILLPEMSAADVTALNNTMPNTVAI